MFNPSGGGIGAIFAQLSNMVNQSEVGMEQNLQQIGDSAAANNGVLSPIQLTQLQMILQSYTALVTTWSSIVKQIGDLDRSIATNIGS